MAPVLSSLNSLNSLNLLSEHGMNNGGGYVELKFVCCFAGHLSKPMRIPALCYRLPPAPPLPIVRPDGCPHNTRFGIMFGPTMYPAPMPFNAPMAAGIPTRTVRQQWQPHENQMDSNLNSIMMLKTSPVGMVLSGVAMPKPRPSSVGTNPSIAMLPPPPSSGWLPSKHAPHVAKVPNFGRNLYQDSGAW